MNDGGTADAGHGGSGSTCPAVVRPRARLHAQRAVHSGTCSDGVCCNINCDKCGSCNTPAALGTCIPIPAGTDPEGECQDSASDPTGMCKGFCNGQARCTYPAAGTTCGTCKACNGVGLCNIKPEDDTACGTIDCDSLDTTCIDYNDLTTQALRLARRLQGAEHGRELHGLHQHVHGRRRQPAPGGGGGGGGAAPARAAATGSGGQRWRRQRHGGSSTTGGGGTGGADGGGTAGTAGGGGGGCCSVGGADTPTGWWRCWSSRLSSITRRRRR